MLFVDPSADIGVFQEQSTAAVNVPMKLITETRLRKFVPVEGFD